jgi:hypothetical protein
MALNSRENASSAGTDIATEITVNLVDELPIKASAESRSKLCRGRSCEEVHRELPIRYTQIAVCSGAFCSDSDP